MSNLIFVNSQSYLDAILGFNRYYVGCGESYFLSFRCAFDNRVTDHLGNTWSKFFEDSQPIVNAGDFGNNTILNIKNIKKFFFSNEFKCVSDVMSSDIHERLLRICTGCTRNVDNSLSSLYIKDTYQKEDITDYIIDYAIISKLAGQLFDMDITIKHRRKYLLEINHFLDEDVISNVFQNVDKILSKFTAPSNLLFDLTENILYDGKITVAKDLSYEAYKLNGCFYVYVDKLNMVFTEHTRGVIRWFVKIDLFFNSDDYVFVKHNSGNDKFFGCLKYIRKLEKYKRITCENFSRVQTYSRRYQTISNRFNEQKEKAKQEIDAKNKKINELNAKIDTLYSDDNRLRTRNGELFSKNRELKEKICQLKLALEKKDKKFDGFKPSDGNTFYPPYPHFNFGNQNSSNTTLFSDGNYNRSSFMQDDSQQGFNFGNQNSDNIELPDVDEDSNNQDFPPPPPNEEGDGQSMKGSFYNLI